jgi:hypothetical protein
MSDTSKKGRARPLSYLQNQKKIRKLPRSVKHKLKRRKAHYTSTMIAQAPWKNVSRVGTQC